MGEIVKFVRCRPDAKVPTRAHIGIPGDVGFDLYSVEYTKILPLQRVLICTGIRLQMPDGMYCHIEDKSGLASKNGLHVLGGQIDTIYRGEIKVILFNSTFNIQDIIDVIQPNAYTSMFGSRSSYTVEPGQKIAQIIFSPYFIPEFVEVDELEETERNENGFGSSG